MAEPFEFPCGDCGKETVYWRVGPIYFESSAVESITVYPELGPVLILTNDGDAVVKIDQEYEQ